MKRLLALALALSLVFSFAVISAAADDTGITMIGGPVSAEAEDYVDLDDFKVGQVAHIEGLGDVEMVKAEWIGTIYSSGWNDFKSGEEAEYLQIIIRVLNTNKAANDYHKMISDIVCDYGDGYQFKGWHRQYKSDTDDARPYEESDSSYEISPLYAGKYMICVTLPNVCVNSGEPLSVSFKIGNSEFTYNHPNK